MALLMFVGVLLLVAVARTAGVHHELRDASTTTNSGAGGCVYSFQVWAPGEDVLRRLRDLEYRCVNTSLDWERQLAVVRDYITQEIFTSRNISHNLQKDILEQKLTDVQLRINLKDMQLELIEMRSDNRELRTVLETMQLLGTNSRIRDRISSTSDGLKEYKTKVDLVYDTMGQLKNSVGDLRAEWLLIKREVQNIQAEAATIKSGQTSDQEDAMMLKRQMVELQEESARLENDQEMMKAVTTKLTKSVNDLKNDVLDRPPSFIDDQAMDRLMRQISDLNSQNVELQKQVIRIREDNTALKKEAIAVALAARNVSAAEISDWLQKLPNLNLPPVQRVIRRQYPKDCQEVYQSGFHQSGVYLIQPKDALHADNVYCEMINGTGWTVIQRRTDGTVSFSRRWMEYMHGFGSLYGEFWLGNLPVHHLTSQNQCKLRIDMWEWEGGKKWAEYDYFKVDSAEDKFVLHVRGFSGNAGDSLSVHDEMAFSTEDSDNDLYMRNCAADYKGGWWFEKCYTAYLNGVYHSGWHSQGTEMFADGIVWYTLKEDDRYSLKKVEMKIRPVYI